MVSLLLVFDVLSAMAGHVFVVMCVCFTCGASGANIKGLFPTAAKSQYFISEALMKGLAARGHSVVMVSCFPQKRTLKNYSDINVELYRKLYNGSTDLKTLDVLPMNILQLTSDFTDSIHSIGNVLKSPEVIGLLSSNITFDVVFHEMFTDDVYLLFAKKFNAPTISLASHYITPWDAERFSIPQNPSYVPGYTTGLSRHMDFFERLHNTFMVIAGNLIYKFKFLPKSVEVFGTYFGNSNKSLINDAHLNVSLFFVNTHFTLFGARLYPPSVVEIGGIHVQAANPLHKDLDRWMNESSEGVIYFSFGSMLRGATLPADKVKAFLQVFESLPQRVLWKWEDDTVEKLPKNVKIMKWIPQRDVLAHPKVKVFISHGGLLGTTEAVVSGVPILGIPMYGDQPNNVAALVENGVAVHVDYNNISVASISYALNALINDKSYKENAKILSQRFLDRPMSPLDTAVYWTEYVIRHHGAPHLQSAAVHLTWYQYYLLDVIAVLTAAVLVILLTIYYIVHSCLRLICSSKPAKLKSN